MPLETVYDYFESDPELPDGIDSVDITRRNNTLIISAVSSDESISKYTPTAQLKASVSETRVFTEEEEARRNAPRWGTPEEEEEEEPTGELIEMAAFKGDRETVLQNSAVQYPMFEVLCTIARKAEKGTLTAIAEVGGELEATRIVDGDDRPASIEVVEGPRNENSSSSGVNWRDNKFIS
ncbi:hypothetical protein ZOD2009_18534 [Haladaptatus paucihalophilus DX253]|uniref:Uncharacterized protein n=1 Tax=Haladaptatus paucihalophilus DX253 TaxID=797209 RepID=E7QY17_HALPU|nr:hypothetical protein ZOD2009_18534 [Haladaptatus paucihalophilus DX253]